MEKQKPKENAIKVLKSKGKSRTKKPKIVASFENSITEESDVGAIENTSPSQSPSLQYFSDHEEEFETEQQNEITPKIDNQTKTDNQTTVSKTLNVCSVQDSSTNEMSEYRKEELKKREEARKKSVAQMKKNWKSQFLSLGMKKAPTAANSSTVQPRPVQSSTIQSSTIQSSSVQSSSVAEAPSNAPARQRAKPKPKQTNGILKTAEQSGTSQQKEKKRKTKSEESTPQISMPGLGSFINDVMLIWNFSDPWALPSVTKLLTPFTCVTSYMNAPFVKTSNYFIPL